MRHPSGKCASRRELNSHDAAKPRDGTLPMLRPPQQMDSDQSRIEARLCQFLGCPVGNRSTCRKSSAERLGAVPHRTSGLRGKLWSSVSSSGRRSLQCQPQPGRVRRLEYAASRGQQRGAGSLGGRPGQVTGHWKAQRVRLLREVLPNPSLKRSANGRPPGPGRRYAVHFRQPGPGVLPLSPA